MEVHKQLGHGFLEPVYQAAMAIELGLGIPYQKEVELPVVYKGKKLKTFEEATVICTLRGHRGKGGGARAQFSGVNWGTSGFPPQDDFLGCSRLRRESISGGEGFRVSDKAVISADPAGQHNPLASQGPLDGRVGLDVDRQDGLTQL